MKDSARPSEHLRWFSAREALDLMEHLYGSDATHSIVFRCNGGTMYARAAVLVDREVPEAKPEEGTQFRRDTRELIPNTFWHPNHALQGDSHTERSEDVWADWTIGDFGRQWKKSERDYFYVEQEASGTEFAGPTLNSLADLLAGDKLASHEKRGGRPASKHGNAIAAATLRLAGFTEPELRRFTSASLAAELADYYREAGEQPPNQRNLENYAAGILRVLRARET